MMLHTMKDGSRISLREMTDGHLLNTIRLMHRKAKSGCHIQRGGTVFCHDEPWYEEETVLGTEALQAMQTEVYEDEARRRGLDI